MISNPIESLRARRNSDDGFTLIELLVVVVILGILIGIAIPVYLNYRKSANDKAAQSDLRGAISTLEICNSDGGYPTAVPASGGVMTAAANGCTQTITRSDNVTFNYYASGTANFIMTATAGTSSGSGKIYCYSSAAGGGVKLSAAITAYAAACPAAP